MVISSPFSFQMGDCKICRVSITNSFTEICGHSFCAVCSETLKIHSRKCPICGVDITLDPLVKPFLEQTVALKRKELSIIQQELFKAQRDLEKFNNVSGKRIKSIDAHFDDFAALYYQRGLESLQRSIINCSRYTQFKRIAILDYADHLVFPSSSIVSSIEFDKDDEFFATAGVTKKIKVFEFESATQNYSGLVSYSAEPCLESDVPRYPVLTLSCESKISCLSWNTNVKECLISSDYEGVVSLWNVQQGKLVGKFEEHTKRIWSVDFSNVDVTRLASAGDDCKVKIWSTNQASSCLTIVTNANVCSVKFNPTKSNEFAIGSSDHQIHYYDIRNPQLPLFSCKGHRKAVSYVKFLGPDQIVTASTDCTLKTWSINHSTDPICVGTFAGHLNEKNFVGLSVNSTGELIACGSETNNIYAYYKEVFKPAASLNFGNLKDTVNVLTINLGHAFIYSRHSSVCQCCLLEAKNSKLISLRQLTRKNPDFGN
jgi:E3 ubiquitin-protein ligase RFWD2